jgi:hypothetical protein
MDDKLKSTLSNSDTWKRGLFMLLFAIISAVAKLVITVMAVFQFLTLLFKGETNKALIPFGQNMSTYMYQITLFITFKTDEMPFPFIAFPDGLPESNNIDGDNEDIDIPATKTKHEEEVSVTVVEDVKEDIGAEKDSKDDSPKS